MPWKLTSDRPIFLQIMERMQTDIIAGKYQPGEKIPSVRELAADAAVNPNTMQKALSELERIGLLYSQRTSGRFITENTNMIHQLRIDLAREQIQQFLNSMELLGFSNSEAIAFIKATIEEDEK